MFQLAPAALVLGLMGCVWRSPQQVDGGADQAFVIEGMVDNVDAMPVPEADVLIEGTAQWTRTDSLGHFSFTSLPDRVYGIQVRKAGYRHGRCDFLLELKARRAVCNVRLYVDSLPAKPRIIN
jgi:hypothetical protein